MKSRIRIGIQISLAILSLLTIAASIAAQDRGEEPPLMKKERDFETSSRELRRISEKPPNEAPRPKPEELLSQARSDFRSIQMANKALRETVAADFDLRLVSTSATEIRERAESLNSILPLPKRDKAVERLKPVASANPDELKATVVGLSKLIQEFIANPCFREASLPDNEQTRKARLDLENIIELSSQVQKDSDKLAKAPD